MPKVLVANRGEIACRIVATLREMGWGSVAVYTDVDAQAPHVWMADEAVSLGAPTRYLDSEALLQAARSTGATAIHPGYGFLSQSPSFAQACTDQGIVFVGPAPEAMADLGDKRAARACAEACGVPVVPGATTCDTVADAAQAAEVVGFPVLLKAAGGGGGKGMRRVDTAAALPEAFAAASREAKNAFDDDRMLVEKYIHPARHIEVQIMGDGKHAVALGERECSLQRRYQKIIEESAAHTLRPHTVQALHEAAVRLATHVGYASAGTVEFLVGPDESFYFLEVNTRLQVEHPVTEMTCGLDIVRLQLEVAHGGPLCAKPVSVGHAIEARLNAEDAYGGFLPASGKILMLRWPQLPRVRVDHGVAEGFEITPLYDPMVAKIIAWGPEREVARRRLITALQQTVLLGFHTNQAFLIDVLQREFFVQGETFTTTIENTEWPGPALPQWASAAVASAETASADVSPAAAAAGDRYSPWQRLGRFRMTPCS